MSSTPGDPPTFDEIIERAAQELSGEARRAITVHPEPEELVAYQEHRLPPGEKLRVRRHLVACSQCAIQVAQLEVFDQPEDAELRPSEEETAAAWQAFREDVGRVRRRVRIGDPLARGNVWPKVLLAASLLFAVTGASFWTASFLHTAETPTSQASDTGHHPVLVDLLPAGENPYRDETTVPEVEAPVAADVLILRLNLGDQTPYPSYRGEITDASGAVVWSRDGLLRQPTGEFLVLVSRTDLPSGKYRVSLSGVGAGRDQALASYSFRLLYDE